MDEILQGERLRRKSGQLAYLGETLKEFFDRLVYPVRENRLGFCEMISTADYKMLIKVIGIPCYFRCSTDLELGYVELGFFRWVDGHPVEDAPLASIILSDDGLCFEDGESITCSPSALLYACCHKLIDAWLGTEKRIPLY